MKFFLKLFSLAIVLTGCFADATDETDEIEKTPDCRELNDLFIKKNSDFVKCVLRHNENATYCEDCIQFYAFALTAYNNLMTLNETDKNSDFLPCRLRFVDANQLNLVETVYGYSKRLWGIGDCSGKINLDKSIEHVPIEHCFFLLFLQIAMIRAVIC